MVSMKWKPKIWIWLIHKITITTQNEELDWQLTIHGRLVRTRPTRNEQTKTKCIALVRYVALPVLYWLSIGFPYCSSSVVVHACWRCRRRLV
jgi:hypothetical protein